MGSQESLFDEVDHLLYEHGFLLMGLTTEMKQNIDEKWFADGAQRKHLRFPDVVLITVGIGQIDMELFCKSDLSCDACFRCKSIQFNVVFCRRVLALGWMVKS